MGAGGFWETKPLLLSPFVFLTYLYTLDDGAKRGIKEQDEAYLFLWCPQRVVVLPRLS